MAAGDAGEVAEAARRVREQQRRVAAPGKVVDQAEGEQVRQVAHRGEDAVVLLRRHADHVGAAGLPGVADLLHGLGAALGQRRQHHLAAHVELGEGGLDPALLGAGDRVRRHHVGERTAQVAAQRGDHVTLGAAGVGHHRAGAQVRRHRGEDRVGLPHRRGEQHQVGAVERIRPALGDLVDDAERARALEHLAPPADADDALDRARTPQREREGAADQADPADDQLADVRHPPPLDQASAWRSASMKRAFSSGSPIDTRSQCGMP